jgi:SAM-dependent methyltransferase
MGWISVLVAGRGVPLHRLLEDEMPRKSRDHDHWSRFADEWIAWARTPDHDPFWAYRASLAAFIGPGGGEVLDVGCGEGRVSRELKALGWRITACDPVPTFIEAAKELDSAHEYVLAPAAQLPFDTGRFPLVVSYNMLMDVEDVPAALKEFRRVMQPGGTLMVSIVHPFADRGQFVDAGPEAAFAVRGTYFGRQRFEGTDERGGISMHFAGWSQPLEAYAAALEGAGLAITSLREPVPALDAGVSGMEKWARMPLFLWLKARPIP